MFVLFPFEPLDSVPLREVTKKAQKCRNRLSRGLTMEMPLKYTDDIVQTDGRDTI